MVESLTIDVLGITDGLVSQIWVVGDELGRLMQLGAVSLAQPPHDLARSRARR
jgi:hypothetical protein